MRFQLRLPFILLLLCQLCIHLKGQNQIEYGVGVGVIFGDYSEDIIFESDVSLPEIDKSRFSMTFQTRSAYILNERWKISLNPSIVIKGANDVFGAQKYTGYNLDFPLLAHFKIWRKIEFMAGPSYSHVLHFTIEEDGLETDVTNSVPNRNIVAGVLGLGYTLNPYLEVILAANADINEAITIRYENDFGMPIGNINLRNQYLSLTILYRK